MLLSFFWQALGLCIILDHLDFVNCKLVLKWTVTENDNQASIILGKMHQNILDREDMHPNIGIVLG